MVSEPARREGSTEVVTLNRPDSPSGQQMRSSGKRHHHSTCLSPPLRLPLHSKPDSEFPEPGSHSLPRSNTQRHSTGDAMPRSGIPVPVPFPHHPDPDPDLGSGPGIGRCPSSAGDERVDPQARRG